MSKRHAQRGFTLIELMITVAVIAILAAVAYPSYVQYGVRAHRKAAQSFLLSIANAQERFLLDARSYAFDTVACDQLGLGALRLNVPQELLGVYRFCIEPVAGAPLRYVLSARPLGNQLANDAKHGFCGNLTYDEQGVKGVAGGTGTREACWDR
ncbi:type IV pilin protein [Ramlibacter sp. AN1015]|uniref:type IV pilin protein n=1 Tax=Ramlibacter sp. AN1015 TaxID=3133428 RepID=UPI0030C3430C